MVDFYPLLEALQSIKGINDTIIKEFENDFRSNISSVDFKYLTTGNIPQNILQNCITSSLQHTAEFCLQHYEATGDLEYFKFSHMIWNPIIAKMFSVITVSIPRSVKTSSATVEKKSSDKITSASKRKADPRVVKPVPVEIDEEDIRRRLNGVVLTKPHLFETPAHKHVQCMKQNCGFCKHLFTHINVTRCEGHKRCTSIGWYPHVGPALWQMVRKRHAADLPCIIKIKECNVGEIPALASAVVNGSPEQQSSRASPPMVSEVDYSSSVEANSPKRSYPTDLRWDEDMSEYYLRKKACVDVTDSNN